MSITSHGESTGVRVAQVVSMVLMWVFVLGISTWIFNLLALSVELKDSLEASIGIGLIAVPVYLTLACVLTYVFIGLVREDRRLRREGRKPE
jgi:hypothetical protein